MPIISEHEMQELLEQKKLKERLNEFLGFIFDAYDSTLTYCLNRNYQLIEVSYRGFYENPQYYSISYKFENGKVYFETTEEHWISIDDWNAKKDLVMHLFLRSCSQYDDLTSEL